MEEQLQQKFPDLQIGRKPGLGSFNGLGMTLIGRRDYDHETGTYVATHCFTFLFIPIIALGAYRVADAPTGGWYCLGKVPLSRFARGWNVFLVLAIFGLIGGIWWNHHTGTPEYAAGKKLREADAAAAAGQGGQAARLCREVIDGNTPKAEEAKTKLRGLITDPPGPPSEAAAVYAVAVELHRENRCPVADLFDKGKALAVKHADADPAAALALLEVIAPFAPDAEAELALRRDLLERLHAKSPDDPDVASKLAAVYEAKSELAKCEKLLAPFGKRLGTRDGAAILGRIYAARGEHDKAYDLLRPFVDARLPQLRTAEQNMAGLFKAAQQRVIDSLRSGNAPGFDYARHKASNQDQKEAMVDDYIAAQMRNDPALREALKQRIAQREVVGAALDLGLVQVQRAQGMPEPGRTDELKAAEQTFLSVRGFAGEDPLYRITLGQVYHWLGRPADGKKLFDEFLASRNHSAEAVVQVAGALREVGDHSGARKLAEDAYARQTDATAKQQVAVFRALVPIDLDDKILWLSRSSPDDSFVQAALATARGYKAEQDGKDDQAADQFRRAIDVYGRMPETSSTLNNSALSYLALYQVTLDRAELTRGMDRLDRAIALDPSNSITLSNGMTALLTSTLRDVVGTEVDLKAIKGGASWDLLPYLYRTPAERAALHDRFAAHPGTVKARGYAEKLMTLAPKREESYATLAGIAAQARDLAALKAVLARVERTELDLADQEQKQKDYLSGAADAKKLDEQKKRAARAEAALAAARPLKGRTFAVAVGRYVSARQAGWIYGEPADADELVKLAEEAHAAAPSAGSESTLESALLFRAHLALIKESPEYAKAAERTRRSVGNWLVYHVLSSDGPLRAKAAANPDVKRLAEVQVEDFRRDPDGSGPGTWVLLRAVLPAEADAVAKKHKADERERVNQQISRKLHPDSATGALTESWMLMLEGKDAEAKKVLAAVAAKGIPMP
jgi:tetratricopeptide (TPR) repeat protein